MTAVGFIIGPSRSGTSVLSQALGRHPEIFATEEMHFYNLLRPQAEAGGEGVEWLWARLVAIQHEGRFFEVKNGTAVDLPTPDPAELPTGEQSLLSAFFDRLAAATGARAVVEQTPMNLYYREEIRRDFPAVRFFMMRRDPRAIIASQKYRWKVGEHGTRPIPDRDIKRVRYAGHPLLQLVLLRKTMRALAEAEAEPDVITVCYENLIIDPERVLAYLSAQLGVDFHTDMTEVTDGGSSHTREGQKRGFDPERLDSWRKSLSATEIWLTECAYGDALTLPKTDIRPHLSQLLWLIATLPVYLGLALFYSAGSYGNLVDAVQRRFL